MPILKTMVCILALACVVRAETLPSKEIFCKPQKGQELSIVENKDKGIFSYPPRLREMGSNVEMQANELYRKNFKELQKIMKDVCEDATYKDAGMFIDQIQRKCEALCATNEVANVTELCKQKCGKSWKDAGRYLEGYANALANENCEASYSPAKSPLPGKTQ